MTICSTNADNKNHITKPDIEAPSVYFYFFLYFLLFSSPTRWLLVFIIRFVWMKPFVCAVLTLVGRSVPALGSPQMQIDCKQNNLPNFEMIDYNRSNWVFYMYVYPWATSDVCYCHHCTAKRELWVKRLNFSSTLLCAFVHFSLFFSVCLSY